MEEKLLYKLKERYTETLVGMLILVCIVLFLFLGSLFAVLDVFTWFELDDAYEIGALVLSSLFMCASIVGFFALNLPYMRDRRMLMRGEYRVIEGVVLRYDFRDDGGDPPTRVEIPIVQDRVTGEIMELDLGSYLIQNACYLIGYLPNTGIAVIDKRIS
jgi:hypothetical protein